MDWTEQIEQIFTGRLVLKNKMFFCVGEYAEHGFDQQRLI